LVSVKAGDIKSLQVLDALLETNTALSYRYSDHFFIDRDKLEPQSFGLYVQL
jgi:hypothetical protein